MRETQLQSEGVKGATASVRCSASHAVQMTVNCEPEESVPAAEAWSL